METLMRSALEDSLRPRRILNYLVAPTSEARAKGDPALKRALRVFVEDYGEAGAIARLTRGCSFTGFGATVEASVHDLMQAFFHDYRFYEVTPESALTGDALAAKKMLQSLLA